MPGAELALAGLQIGATVAEILGYIVRKAREAKQLKEECFRLGNLSAVLLATLNQNKNVLQDVESAGTLRVLLLQLLDFVVFAQREWTVFQKAWEVMWKRRLPRLTTQMVDYLNLCTFETTVHLHVSHRTPSSLARP